MEDFNGLPNPHLEKKAEITQDERDKLMHFNTKRYWHCYYNKDTKALYNEYGRKIKDNAYQYLLGAGMINENSEVLRYFEDE